VKSSLSQTFKSAKRIVVKVGTSVLTERGGDQLSPARVATIAKQVGRIHRAHREIIVVTSGAIAAGMHVLRYKTRPRALQHLQAASAVGQWRLMALYEQAFKRQGFHAAQLLLTKNDLEDRRKLNVKATLDTLLNAGIIPVINENDSVSTEEIRVGDNDQLAAHVAVLAGAQLLIILTDDALRNDKWEIVPQVSRADIRLAKSWAKDTNKATSAGGMQTKLLAAELATAQGIQLVIANAGGSYTLTQVVLEGKNPGTVFTP